MDQIRPDEGMRALFARSEAGPALPADVPAAGADADLDIGARLVWALDGMADAARRLAAVRERNRLSWEECHLVDIPPGQSQAAGVINQPDVWGPRDRFVWQVLWVPVILGPSGTNVTMFRDSANAVTNTVLESTQSGLFEPKALFLMPGRFIVWSSAGDALTVCTGQAVEIAIDALPAYLL